MESPKLRKEEKRKRGWRKSRGRKEEEGWVFY